MLKLKDLPKKKSVTLIKHWLYRFLSQILKITFSKDMFCENHQKLIFYKKSSIKIE